MEEKRLFLLLLCDADFLTKGSQDLFHKGVETTQSRQEQSEHWQLLRTRRDDKGKWTNSNQKAEGFGLGGDNFGSLILYLLSKICGMDSVIYLLLLPWQLYILKSLVYNTNPKPFPSQAPPVLRVTVLEAEDTHPCASPQYCGMCWLSTAISAWIGNRLT